MFKNPFTPVFGGKPDFFFGRKSILVRFDAAMIDRGSEDRVLFVTGNRGCGKTALLEQLSIRASSGGWEVIDLGPENAVEVLMRRLASSDEMTRGRNPQVSLSVMGTGASVGGVSSSQTVRRRLSDLVLVFLEACEKAEKGILVTIDEVQRVPLEAMSAICGAFQMASRKGYDVMLAVAGLPYAYEQVIHFEGCTYMRRSVHEELGLMEPEEVSQAFEEAFGQIEGLSVDQDSLGRLVKASMGQPYVMQLLGYYLLAEINNRILSKRYRVSRKDVEEVIPMAIAAYERRALKPLVDELTGSERTYLLAMAEVAGEDGTSTTHDVAHRIGKTTSQLSRVRESLLNYGTIIAPERGRVMFNVAYLRGYIGRAPSADANVTLALRWGL